MYWYTGHLTNNCRLQTGLCMETVCSRDCWLFSRHHIVSYLLLYWPPLYVLLCLLTSPVVKMGTGKNYHKDPWQREKRYGRQVANIQRSLFFHGNLDFKLSHMCRWQGPVCQGRQTALLIWCVSDSIKTSIKWNVLSEAFPDFSKLYWLLYTLHISVIVELKLILPLSEDTDSNSTNFLLSAWCWNDHFHI